MSMYYNSQSIKCCEQLQKVVYKIINDVRILTLIGEWKNKSIYLKEFVKKKSMS